MSDRIILDPYPQMYHFHQIISLYEINNFKMTSEKGVSGEIDDII